MPSLLLDKGVEWHTRKGLREDCDCNYCLKKKRGTYEIANEAYENRIGYSPRSSFGNYFTWYDKETMQYIREGYRERQREELRQELENLKQVVL